MAKFGPADNEQIVEQQPAGQATPPPQSNSYNLSPTPSQVLTPEVRLAEIAYEQKRMDIDLLDKAVQNDQWFKSYWRPGMGWLYMLICAFDFIIAPIVSMFIPLWLKGTPYTPWKSITLENGGMIHLAFGAILGVTAWTRGEEKKAFFNKVIGK